MKNLIKLSFVLFAMLGALLTSCKKDYPEPPIQVLPVGTIYTIGQILEMESGTVFNEDASVYGIVTADEKSGNLYKAAFLQDRATGKAIELYLNATSGVRIGDSIRVYLKDVTYALYNGLPQLSNFEADGHIIILANDRPIQPAEATIADIVTGKYLGGLVKLSNVMFTDKGTFADPTGYGSRTLVDPSNLTQSVIVRTSNYANFANDSLPQGTGNLIAIATVYNQTWQLLIRSAKELEFDGYNPGGGGDGAMTLPYYQSFASNFGTYSTYDVAGAQSWEIDYSTAKMTGFENSINYANEDWLISSPVSFEGVNGVSMTMTYIARYFNNLNEDITTQVSTDYQSGNPNDATWERIPASWVSGSDWSTFAQTTIDLSKFAGQVVRVAVKYLSTDQKAGTIEVQSIAIQEGNGPTPPPGPNPGGEVQYLPYTQSFATEFGTYMAYDKLGSQSWEIDYSTAKMTGYIGGSYYANEDWLISSPVSLTGVNSAKMTMSYIGRYFNKINDEVTIWASTDYTWGSDPASANWKQIPASLVEGTNWNDFLTAEISLVDVSGQSLAGQTATFAIKYTSTDAKAGTMEIQSITIEEGGGVNPPPGPNPGGELQSMPYTQSFATDFGTYTTYDVLGPQSWIIDYQTAKMTGYQGGANNVNEDWLISSPVALVGVNGAKVAVTYVAQYKNDNPEDVTLQVSTDYVYGNSPATANWTQMPTSYPNTANWNDFQTIETSLNSFLNQNVTVAIKFTSTSSQSRTIEVQSITVKEGSGSGPGPGTGNGTVDDPYNVESGIGLQNQDITAWVQGYIVGAVKNGLSSVNSNSDIIWNSQFDNQTNVVIADDPNCHEVSQCIIVHLPYNKPLRSQVNLVDHPENLGKQLSVLGKLYTYFGQAGLRDSNGTENDFFLGGGTPPVPPTPGEVIFSESFANGQGNFVIEDVFLPDGLTYVWSHASNFSCMKASAYVNHAYETESWLVSPAISLVGVNSATLSFEQAVNYASPNGALHVMISTNYVNSVNTATWTELNLSEWPSGTNWTFGSSTADLSPYVGQSVNIAFKYTSTNNSAATWEVKNFVVEN